MGPEEQRCGVRGATYATAHGRRCHFQERVNSPKESQLLYCGLGGFGGGSSTMSSCLVSVSGDIERHNSFVPRRSNYYCPFLNGYETWQ